MYALSLYLGWKRKVSSKPREFPRSQTTKNKKQKTKNKKQKTKNKKQKTKKNKLCMPRRRLCPINPKFKFSSINSIDFFHNIHGESFASLEEQEAKQPQQRKERNLVGGCIRTLSINLIDMRYFLYVK